MTDMKYQKIQKVNSDAFFVFLLLFFFCCFFLQRVVDLSITVNEYFFQVKNCGFFSPFLGWVAFSKIFFNLLNVHVWLVWFIFHVFLFFSFFFNFLGFFLYWSFVLMRLQKPGLTITCIIYPHLIRNLICYLSEFFPISYSTRNR